MKNLALSVALATAPSSAFGELRERPRFWFPLLLVIASTAAITFWYYSVVDVDWLKDVMFGNNPGLAEEQRTVAMNMTNRTTLLWSSLILGALIGIPVWVLLQALFLQIAAKVTRVPVGFKHWIAMSSWTMLTALLSIVVAAILLVLSETTQVSPGVMQPLSLNELLFHRPIGSPGQGFLDSLTIPSLLAWILMIIGVRVWSQRSWLFSAAFVLVPVVVIYSVFAFLAFR